MQLKLSRSQKSGLTGKVTFSLHAMVLLTNEEQAALVKYKLGKEVIWVKNKVDPTTAGSALGAIGKIAAAAALNISITIDNLAQGRVFECKEITEMLATEAEIHQACEVLAQVLDAASHFDGEELIDIQLAA